MSSVDIKSETDSLRPDSPKCQDNLLNSKFLNFFPPQHTNAFSLDYKIFLKVKVTNSNHKIMTKF